MPTSRTEYILGLNTRSECRSCTGHSDTFPPVNIQYDYGPLRAYIKNRDLHYGFELDLDAREYTAWRANEFGSPAWIQPRRVGQTSGLSGQAGGLSNHTQTIRTEERKVIYGYTARRVITKTRTTRGSGIANESESDGWYIDPPAAWLALHPPMQKNVQYHLCAAGDKIDHYEFTQEGERETGFAVLLQRFERSYFHDSDGAGRSHESSSRDEVTEFSEAALDPDLFVPPLGFRRVMQLGGGARYPFSERLRLRWEMIKDSFRRS